MGQDQLKNIHTLQVRQRATDLLKIVGNKTMGDAPAAVLKYLKIEAQRLPTYARLAAVDAVCQVSVAGDEDTVESLVGDDELPIRCKYPPFVRSTRDQDDAPS
jgi:hypothetical protein